MKTTSTVDKAHGRIEIRTIQSCELLTNWLQATGFTNAKQAIRIERTRKIAGKVSVSVDYYITSLDPTCVPVFDLLKWIRAHWLIENQSHHVRDVTLGEDASRVRKGNSAQVMAALRNAVIHLLEDVDAVSKRAATHRLQVHPEEAIELLMGTQCET